MKALSTLFAVATFAVLGGCSSASPGPAQQGTSEQPTSAGLSGYVHEFKHSRFAIGSPTHSTTEFGMAKVIGPWGVFATRQDTHMVLAQPNAGAPSRAEGPLPGGSAAQNSAVESYFVGAGLPANQIQEVSTFTTTGGPSGGTYSELKRQYEGIPIVDSYAWARMDGSREVVTESVYWPAIPESVLQSADAFAAKLSDATWKTAFLAKLPGEGQLVIHHTSGVWTGAFEAQVSYDVPAVGGQVLHFDWNGTTIELPEDASGAGGP